MRTEKLFKTMVEKGASDLFLRAHAAPHVRIDGRLQVLDDKVLTKEEMTTIADFLLGNDTQREQFAKNLDIDFIYQDTEVGRFRINIFTQRGTPAHDLLATALARARQATSRESSGDRLALVSQAGEMIKAAAAELSANH